MRILVLGINYYPERTSVSPFTTGLCDHLAAQGHEVHVVTAFPYYPEWRIWKGYRGRITQLETRNRVKIRRVLHFIPWRASSLVQRLAHDFSFTLAAFAAAVTTNRCDVVYCSCPPPLLALAAWGISRIRGVPYTIKLTDLASDAAIATGILRDGLFVRAARAIERFAYRHAAAVVCLCDAFSRRLMCDGIHAEQLTVIPDWGDTDALRPVPSDGSFRRMCGIAEDCFVVLHTGNMGKKQHLLTVVRAAEQTRTDPKLIWVIVGEGEERAVVENARRDLSNLFLLPLQPKEAMAQMYAGADVVLLNQKLAVKDAVIPSKLLTYMAAGRPVLCAANSESEAARLIHEAECGHLVPPENPGALAAGAIALRSDPASRTAMAANALAYAVAHFEKAHVLSLYDEFFETLLRTVGTAAAVTAH